MSAVSAGQVNIENESDIVVARRAVRELGTQIGFTPTDVTRIVTAASELARNVFQYAGKGTMQWRALADTGRQGVELRFVDQGPGIADLNLALQPGFTTGEGLGMGLPGTKRLMDEMEIESAPGKGTSITVRKWRKM
jgi:serine/threonine-protein kinase RsbT